MIGRTTGIALAFLSGLACSGLLPAAPGDPPAPAASADVILVFASSNGECTWGGWSPAHGETTFGRTPSLCPRQQIFVSPHGDQIAYRPDKSDGHLEQRLATWPSLRELRTAKSELVDGSYVDEWVEGDGELHMSLHVGVEKKAAVEASFGIVLDLGAPDAAAPNLHVHVESVDGTWSVVEARQEAGCAGFHKGQPWRPLLAQRDLDVLVDLDKAEESVRAVDAQATNGMEVAAFVPVNEGGWLVGGLVNGVDEEFEPGSSIFSCADPACRGRVALQGVEPGRSLAEIHGDYALVGGSVYVHGQPQAIHVFAKSWSPRGWFAETSPLHQEGEQLR